MKFLPLLGLLSVLVLAGCRGPVASEPDVIDPDLPGVGPNLARVVIPLPTPPVARGVGLDNARDHANYFEVIFGMVSPLSGLVFSASASAQDGLIEIDMPVGTYDILLLASNRYICCCGSSYEGTRDQLLLASSYELGRTIVAGRNQVDMELGTIHVDIYVPAQVPAAAPFTVDLVVYTRNPLLVFRSWGALALDVSGANLLDTGWRGGLSGNFIDVSVDFFAPLQAGSGQVDFQGSVEIPFGVNDGDIDRSFAQPWRPVLGQYFSRPVNFFAQGDLPAVDISVTWPGSELPIPQRTQVFSLATDNHFQGLEIGRYTVWDPDNAPHPPGATPPGLYVQYMFDFTHLRAAGGADNVEFYVVPGPDGQRSIQFRALADWGPGIDLAHSEFSFRAGDTVRVSGYVLDCAGGSLQLNRSIGSQHAIAEAWGPGPFSFDLRLTAGDVSSIINGSPSGLRLEARALDMTVRVDEISVLGRR